MTDRQPNRLVDKALIDRSIEINMTEDYATLTLVVPSKDEEGNDIHIKLTYDKIIYGWNVCVNVSCAMERYSGGGSTDYEDPIPIAHHIEPKDIAEFWSYAGDMIYRSKLRSREEDRETALGLVYSVELPPKDQSEEGGIV